MFGEGKVYRNCRNASNPYHECSEYCFKVLAETEPRMNHSQSAAAGSKMNPDEFKACVKCTEKCSLVHGNKRDASPVTTSFVTVMSGNQFSKFMELPPSVARAVSLADQFTFIEDSQGRRWNVTISSMDGFAFHHGWSTFSLDHDLQLGNILVFTYIKGSHFAVKIYDNSGCELNSFETDQKKRKRDDRESIFKGGWCYVSDKSSMSKDVSGTCGCSDADEISKRSEGNNVGSRRSF